MPKFKVILVSKDLGINAFLYATIATKAAVQAEGINLFVDNDHEQVNVYDYLACADGLLLLTENGFAEVADNEAPSYDVEFADAWRSENESWEAPTYVPLLGNENIGLDESEVYVSPLKAAELDAIYNPLYGNEDGYRLTDFNDKDSALILSVDGLIYDAELNYAMSYDVERAAQLCDAYKAANPVATDDVDDTIDADDLESDAA